METFISLVHITVAVLLIVLVLIQDSKGGGLGMMGGGGSNSVLGSTGADNLVVKLTRWVALTFAATCIGLTLWNAKGTKSVLDEAPLLPVTNPGSADATKEAPNGAENLPENPGN